jgi:hypothetical protein
MLSSVMRLLGKSMTVMSLSFSVLSTSMYRMASVTFIMHMQVNPSSSLPVVAELEPEPRHLGGAESESHLFSGSDTFNTLTFQQITGYAEAATIFCLSLSLMTNMRLLTQLLYVVPAPQIIAFRSV